MNRRSQRAPNPPPLAVPPSERASVAEQLGARTAWRMLGSTERHPLACIDGRCDRPVVGTPGGDVGEIVLLASTVERHRSEPLSDVLVVELTSERARTSGLYLHTDALSLAQLVRALRGTQGLERYADAIGPTGQGLRTPPPAEYREAALKQLVRPEHQGCGHLQLLLEASKDYGVRRGLVEAALRAFYEVLWAGQPHVQLEVLPGLHEEDAVVVVSGPDGLCSDVPVPLVKPREGKSSYFVHHATVMAYCRQRALDRWLERADLVPAAVSSRSLAEGVRRDAAHQLQLTVQRLASHLPLVEVHASRGRLLDAPPEAAAQAIDVRERAPALDHDWVTAAE